MSIKGGGPTPNGKIHLKFPSCIRTLCIMGTSDLTEFAIPQEMLDLWEKLVDQNWARWMTIWMSLSLKLRAKQFKPRSLRKKCKERPYAWVED